MCTHSITAANNVALRDSVHVVRNKTWYEAYAMRRRAKPRTKEMFGSQPAINQWNEILEMSLYQFAQRCKRSALAEHLVVGMRDLD